nr:MAG TPA: hypothetical protein [Caudoviricetes sp.]
MSYAANLRRSVWMRILSYSKSVIELNITIPERELSNPLLLSSQFILFCLS